MPALELSASYIVMQLIFSQLCEGLKHQEVNYLSPKLHKRKVVELGFEPGQANCSHQCLQPGHGRKGVEMETLEHSAEDGTLWLRFSRRKLRVCSGQQVQRLALGDGFFS